MRSELQVFELEILWIESCGKLINIINSDRI